MRRAALVLVQLVVAAAQAPVFSLQSIKPNTLTTAGGYIITFLGTNFPQDSEPTIGGVACQTSEWVSTSMAPPGAGANLPAALFSPSLRTSVQLPTGFSYFRSKVLTLNPRKGSLKGHRLLIIGGYEFGSYDSKPVAYVGNRPCIETAWHGPNELECLTPESKTLGKERVSVSVGGQISFPSRGVAYRYILPTSASDLHLDGLLSKLPCLGLSVDVLAEVSALSTSNIVAHLSEIAHSTAPPASLSDSVSRTATNHMPVAFENQLDLARGLFKDAEDAWRSRGETCIQDYRRQQPPTFAPTPTPTPAPTWAPVAPTAAPVVRANEKPEQQPEEVEPAVVATPALPPTQISSNGGGSSNNGLMRYGLMAGLGCAVFLVLCIGCKFYCHKRSHKDDICVLPVHEDGTSQISSHSQHAHISYGSSTCKQTVPKLVLTEDLVAPLATSSAEVTPLSGRPPRAPRSKSFRNPPSSAPTPPLVRGGSSPSLETPRPAVSRWQSLRELFRSPSATPTSSGDVTPKSSRRNTPKSKTRSADALLAAEKEGLLPPRPRSTSPRPRDTYPRPRSSRPRSTSPRPARSPSPTARGRSTKPRKPPTPDISPRDSTPRDSLGSTGSGRATPGSGRGTPHERSPRDPSPHRGGGSGRNTPRASAPSPRDRSPRDRSPRARPRPTWPTGPSPLPDPVAGWGTNF